MSSLRQDDWRFMRAEWSGKTRTPTSQPVRASAGASKDAQIAALRNEIARIKQDNAGRVAALAREPTPLSTRVVHSSSGRHIQNIWDSEGWQFGSHWRCVGKPEWMKLPHEKPGRPDLRSSTFANGGEGPVRGRRNIRVKDSSMDTVKTGTGPHGLAANSRIHVRG